MQRTLSNKLLSQLFKKIRITKLHIVRTLTSDAPKEALDPIQKLFIQSLREYARKLHESDGKLFDPIPELEKEQEWRISVLYKQYYKDEKVNVLEFPKFNFIDKPLDEINLVPKK
uniref:Putative atp synthase-coupling factor 6 mitochondrial-like cimex lectularius n=1 Tax=Rhodnius prolixus TaxID=13249 RepID=A0A4P6DA08_RHOPR